MRLPALPQQDARYLPLTLPHVCRLCGWQYQTVNGLWAHIPTHAIDRATYGTLVTAEQERDAARADLAASARREAALRAALEGIRVLSASKATDKVVACSVGHIALRALAAPPTPAEPVDDGGD